VKNKWLTFVESAESLEDAKILGRVGDGGFSDVTLNQSPTSRMLTARCGDCDRTVRASIRALPPRHDESKSLLAASISRVRRLPQSNETKIVIDHLASSTFLVVTEHRDVLHDCDCDYRLHISLGRFGQYMSYVDDRGFADEACQFLEFEPE